MLNVKQVPSPSPKPRWTKLQERLLQVLLVEENRQKTLPEICQLAGYAGVTSWYEATRDPEFVVTVEAIGVVVQRNKHTGMNKHHLAALSRHKEAQQRIWEVLQSEENHRKPMSELCTLANCSLKIWKKAFEDEHFAARVEEKFSWPPKHRKKTEHHLPNIEVTLARDIEEELAKDTWDMRRLKSDYPKHNGASDFIVNFVWIANFVL